MEPPIASRRGLRHAVVAALVVSATLAPRALRAQAPADAARAQTLFDEARELMKDDKFSEACPKLEQSQALDPGGGTLLNLGICRMREGRTATALAVLREALSQARAADRKDRIATAERYLAELAPILSSLTVRSAAVAAPADLVIEVDGVRLSPEKLGNALPFDPGLHEVRASQPGHVAWVTQVSLGARADAQTVEVPLLETVSPEAGAMPNKPPPAAAGTVTRPKATSSAPRDEPAKGPNWLGTTLVGAGGALLLTGGYFGLRALSLKAESDRYFNGEQCTQQSCVDDWESAKDAALVSNVCFGVGAAVLGAGVYVFLRPPGEEQGSRAHKGLGFSVRPTQGGARASGFVEF